MYKNTNDYELLYLIAENDEKAYNDIYSKYDNLIKMEAKRYYKKCKYLGISFEDIYQAGLYGFSLAISNFSEREGVLFYTYANTFINREIQTLIRNSGRQKHNILSDGISLNKEIDEDGNTLVNLLDSGSSTLNQYEDYLINKKILEFKYSLSDLYSMIFELRLNNFSNKEISLLLDIKYKTVDNAVRSIKDKFKKELNKIELF